jgi:hypothetical protein
MRTAPLVFVVVASALTPAVSAQAQDTGIDPGCESGYVSGQRLYKLEHDLLGARKELLVCARSCPEQLRESCGRWLKEIDSQLPTVVIKAKDGYGHDLVDASVAIDGTPVADYSEGAPLELNPGEHAVRVTVPGKRPVEQAVLVHVGEKLRVVDVYVEPPVQFVTIARRPMTTATWVLLGVSAAGLASYGVFGTWSAIEYSKTNNCRPYCPTATRDGSFQTKTIAADVSLGVSAAALAASAVLFLTRPRITERIPRVALSPVLVPGLVGAVVATGF